LRSAFLDSVLRFLREALTENVGLKVLSFTFAVGLFAFMYGEQEEQQRTVPVGVVMRPPPEGSQRELMTQIPASIHVTLRGQGRSIERLVQTGVPPVEIDLRSASTEQVVFDESMFSLPPDISVSMIDPPSIDLEWEDVIARQIPVQASITGQPAEGYVVKGEPEVDPKQMTVRGPASLVEVMQFARLAAFDVSGLSEGVHKRRISIDAPPSRVRYIGPPAASVTVTVARRVVEAKFQNRPVEVIGLSSATLMPRTVDVTVVGPPEIVRALRAEQIAPQADLTKALGVDLKTQKHGSAAVKVTVDLAHADAEVQPPSVTVRW
jgi:YbbR domain-containing protein